MMAIRAQDVKRLRDKTGLGMMDCKQALVEADGDETKAIEILRMKGMKVAESKRSRAATEGVVAGYVHTNNRVGALVELSCETDFVARNAEFARLAHDLCMQVVALAPASVSPEQLPDELVEREKAIYREQAKGKPDHIIGRIVEGKLEALYRETCLLHQPFIKDESGKQTVGDLLQAAVAKLGENIVVRRFCRFEVGDSAEQETAEADTGQTT
jgi:elongation factor Ts